VDLFVNVYTPLSTLKGNEVHLLIASALSFGLEL